MRKIDMRIIRCIVIVGILFSYIPVFPMDECSETNHMGNLEMDCGYLFHCPMIIDLGIPETSSLPLNGRVVLKKPMLIFDELTHPIFHPPEYLSLNFILQGRKGKEQLSMGLWHKNC
jgi:hypothetical protein